MQYTKEQLEALEKFRLMDDDFMAKVFDENNPAVELVLRIVLQREVRVKCAD